VQYYNGGAGGSAVVVSTKPNSCFETSTHLFFHSATFTTFTITKSIVSESAIINKEDGFITQLNETMSSKKLIGEKIAGLRAIKKIEPEQLATRTGLDVKQLNLIESGHDIPSLGVLIRISRALGVRLGTFLDDEDKTGPSVVRANHLESSASFSTNNPTAREHISFYSMAPDKAGRHMEPFMIEIQPGQTEHLPKSSHEGEEFIFVMDGAIKVEYGKNTYILEKGDSIYLDSVVDHLVTANGNTPAKAIAVVYIPV
jgi:quercetin dioxygenase-like cupin family protein/DNA-binding XRE family transcriptional regulator